MARSTSPRASRSHRARSRPDDGAGNPCRRFSPSDIREPYSKIIGEDVGVDRFNPQFTSLATTREILIREGENRRWRYRFKDPLMEPYVLLEGLRSGAIKPADFPPTSR